MNNMRGMLSLETIKSNWRGLSQTGAWLVGTLSVFVFAPPTEVGSDSAGTFRSLCVFVLASLMGILSISLSKLKSKDAASGWAVVAVLLLCSGISLFFWYQSYRSEWSVDSGRSRVVIGSELTEDGKTYMQTDRPASNEQAVFEAGGKPERIWTAGSIHSKAQRLYTIYFCLIIALSLAAVTAIQTRYCVLQEPGKSQARRSAARFPN
jgi:hypothetical protein